MRLTSSRAYSRPTPVPRMPPGLVELMEGMARDVLKNNPSNVYEFCASHMEKLLEIRDGPFKKKLLTLDQKILNAQEKVRQRAKERQERFDREMKILSNKSSEDKPTCNKTDVNSIQDAAIIQSLKAPIHHEHDLEHASEVEISQVPQVSDTSKHEELNTIEEVLAVATGNSGETENETVEIITDKKPVDEPIFGKVEKDEIMVEPLKEFQTIEIIGQEAVVESQLQTIIEASDENYVSESTVILPEITIDDEHGVRAHGNVTEESVQDMNLTVTNDMNKDHSDEIRAFSEIEIVDKSEVESNVLDASNESKTPENPAPESVIVMSNSDSEKDISNVKSADLLTDNEKQQNDSETVEVSEIINVLPMPTYTSENKSDDNAQSIITIDINYNNGDIINSAPADANQFMSDSQSLVTPLADILSAGTLHSEDLNNEQSHKVANVDVQSNRATIMTENEDTLVNEKGGEAAIKSITDGETKTENNSAFADKQNREEDGSIAETRANDVIKMHDDTLTVNKNKMNLDKPVSEVKNNGETKLADEHTLMTTGNNTIEGESVKADDVTKAENEHSHVSEVYKADLSTNISVLDTVKMETDEMPHKVETKEGIPENDNENNRDNTEILLNKSEKPENTNEDSISIVESDSSKTDDDSQNNPNNMDLETAAVTIQNVFRSLMFNKNSTFEDTTNDEHNTENDEDNESKKEEYYAAANMNKERRPLGITRMDTVLQTVNEEKSLSLSTDDSSTLSSAATTIQAHVRGFLVRNRLNSSKTFSMNSLVNSHEVLETDPEQQKNKTILNIHIVPEEGNYLSRDESLLTSMDLSLDGSPPSSVNLHPMSYDTTERRKMLKREDAVQSVSPPSNNSGKLSEDSVKEVSINENVVLGRESTDEKSNETEDQTKDLDIEVSEVVSTASTVTPTTIITISKSEEPLKSPREYTETALRRNGRSFTSSDESDVITPFASPRSSDKASKLIHSGEFHDVVLPTKVSRNDTSVVRGE